MFRTLLAVRQVAQNPINFASRRQFVSRIAEKQKHFQEDNGIPVHLKNGIMDSMLYRITMTLSVFVHYDEKKTKPLCLKTKVPMMSFLELRNH
uniref:Cytochrome c oxidase subunit 7A2, mitochondrial n=1 Tax=Naja naja TaxID=35670 RepID=A0A8C6Y0F4_NAJNA